MLVCSPLQAPFSAQDPLSAQSRLGAASTSSVYWVCGLEMQALNLAERNVLLSQREGI